MVHRGWIILRSLLEKGLFSNLIYKELTTKEFDSGVQSLWTKIKSISGKRELSLDNLHDIKISKVLSETADGILNHKSSYQDSMSQHMTYKTAWNILILGLMQKESVARYLALKSILLASTELCSTLVEESAKQALVKSLLTLVSGDERKENRLMGIYVLGKIGFFLGGEPGHEALSMEMYKELTSKMIQMQFEQRYSQSQSPESRETKIRILSAMGKFTRVSAVANSENSKYMDELFFHVAREELNLNPEDKVIGKTILHILNTEINASNKNRAVVGTLFMKHVHNLLKSEKDELHNDAVQFASLWLPVESELASLMAVKTQMAGLIEACELVPEYKEKALEKELKELSVQKEKEEAVLSKKSSVFRQLLNPPGTSTKLDSLNETPGFFVDTNSTLVYTSDIVVSLPINQGSFVSVSRPLPPIPGVPPTATTVPSTIMDPAFAVSQNPPCSKYEARERDGHVPGLPAGFTYSPGAFVDKKDISPEFSSVPLSDDADKSQIPRGFLKNAPNINGIAPFNPNKYKTLNLERSPIRVENRQRKETFDDQAKIPESFTSERHPILWPTTNPNLSNQHPETDFPINAPVLFEIVEPGSRPIKFLTKVVSIDKEVTPISVESEKGLFDKFGLGNSFSIYIRPRGKNSSWQSVNVEVVGDSYGEDPINLARKDIENRIIEPVPSGVTPKGDHYFAPLVNFPPVPIGYTDEGVPYYSKTQSVKPIPTVVSKGGKRFYASSRFKDPNRMRQQQNNILAGYDNYGQPFFIPPGCSIPPPVGFTEDGIPFYDIATIVRQKGIIQVSKKKGASEMLQSLEDGSDESGIQSPTNEEDDEAEEELDQFDANGVKIPGLKKTKKSKETSSESSEVERQAILSKVLSSLVESKPEVRKLIEQQEAAALAMESKISNSIARRGDVYGSDELLTAEELLKDPKVEDYVPPNESDAILELFHEAHLLDGSSSGNAGTKMAMQFDPARLEFQSVRANVTKNITLKYSQPQDGIESYYYLSTKPSDIFVCKTYQLHLQGSGEISLPVSYHPMAMKSEKSDGTLNIIDEMGKKLASARLIGVCESFVKVTAKPLDFGWIMPESSKELTISIENVSSTGISVETKFVQSKSSPSASMNNIPFHSLESDIKLHPGQVKQIPIAYSPTAQGSHSYVLQIHAPGGEIIELTAVGYCGVPLVVFPEPDVNDEVSKSELSRERTVYVKNILKKIESGIGLHPPSHGATKKTDPVEEKLFKTIYYSSSHKVLEVEDAYTIDLGLVSRNAKYQKKLSLLNMCNLSFTLAFFTRDPCIKVEEKARVASRSANTVDILIDLNNLKYDQGDYLSCFEIICPGFQNIPVFVKGFLGQPLFIPLWSYVVFKPIAHGQSDVIKTVIVNQSQYGVSFALSGVDQEIHVLEKEKRFENQFFCNLSSDLTSPSFIKPHSSMQVQFKFKAGRRGPLLSKVTCNIVSPTSHQGDYNAAEMDICAFRNPLYLVGLCLQSHSPSVDANNRNNFDFIRSWASNPMRILQDYPKSSADIDKLFDSSDILAGGSTVAPPTINFKFETLTFRPQANLKVTGEGRRPQILNSLIQNKLSEPVRCDFITSTCFGVDPSSRNLLGNDTGNLEVIYTSPGNSYPDFVTIYGFVVGTSDADNSITITQTIAKNRIDFLTCPICKSVDDEIIIDFGHIENTSPVLKSNSRTITICNSGTSNLGWSLKFTNTKTTAFEPNKSSGELGPGDFWPLTITFAVKAHGFYEATAEIYVREGNDKNAKPQKAGTIVMRGEHIPFDLTGIPESIDFGHLLINRPKTNEFIISNQGTQSCTVTAVSKDPFDLVPKSIVLEPKLDENIQVSFLPIESKSFSSKIQLFSGNLNQTIDVTGVGGTCSLICDQFEQNIIDFGEYQMGSSIFTDVFLTNKGTLPLQVNAISAADPSIVSVYFIQVAASGATLGNSDKGTGGVLKPAAKGKFVKMIKMDYWKIIKKRLSSVLALAFLKQKATILEGVSNNNSGTADALSMAYTMSTSRKGALKKRVTSYTLTGGAITKTPILLLQEEPGKDVVSPVLFGSAALPELKPLYSYQFRIGLRSEYQSKSGSTIKFHYVPLLNEPDEDINELQKHLTFNVNGALYFPLEFFPPYYDFGLAPAESNYAKDSNSQAKPQGNNYGVIRNTAGIIGSNVLTVTVTNRSRDSQNFSIKSISKGFTCKDKSWVVDPGQRLSITIEFHPVKAQTQYRGEVVFTHDHGENAILLVGTGASADISIDSEINFGKAIIQKKVSKFLTLNNRGYLPSKFLLQLVQQGSNDYRFVNDDPNEIDGVLESGTTRKIEVECHVKRNVILPAHALFRYQSIADGPWEELEVPFEIAVGVPNFQISSQIADFGTTFLSNKKFLTVTLTNGGSAECQWHLKNEDPAFLHVEPRNGVLLEGSSVQLELLYSPTDYNPLNHVLYFETDVGIRTLSCVGIVGVPYLKIDEADSVVDFGIIEVNKIHSRSISVMNTAPKALEFMAGVQDGFSNGKEIPSALFDHFFMGDDASSHGSIPSKSSIPIVFSARPRDYGVKISATYTIKTSEGEEVFGSLAFIGGQAIISVDQKDSYLARHKVDISTVKLTLNNHLSLIEQAMDQMRDVTLIPDAISEIINLRGPLTKAVSQVSLAARGSIASINQSVSSPVMQLKGRGSIAVTNPNMSPTQPSVNGSSLVLNQTLPIQNLTTPLGSGVNPQLISFENVSEKVSSVLLILYQAFQKVYAEFSQSSDHEVVSFEKLDSLDAGIFATCSQVIEIIQEGSSSEPKPEDLVILSQIEESCHSVRELSRPIDNIPEYDMGLLRPGVSSDRRKLWICSNTGNMDASMKLRRITDLDVMPIESLGSNKKTISGTAPKSFFNVAPLDFSLSTGTSVTVYGSLTNAHEPGQYSVTFDILQLPDKVVDQFRLVGKIGKTALVWSATNIDFGLLPRKSSVSKTVTITNVGEFEENYVIAETGSQMNAESPFDFALPSSSVSGTLAPNKSVSFNISFAPDVVGHYQLNVPVKWWNASRNAILTLTGDCGSPEIHVSHTDASGFEYKDADLYLDFGNSFIGTVGTRRIIVSNIGKVAGELDFFLPSAQMRLYEEVTDGDIVVAENLETEGDAQSDNTISKVVSIKKIDTENRKIILKPGDVTNLILELTCERREAIDGNIAINVKDYDKLTIPVLAMVGKPSYSAKGILQYFNMPIDEEQTQEIEVVNDGDFPLPFNLDYITGTSHPDAFGYRYDFTSVIDGSLISSYTSEDPTATTASVLQIGVSLKITIIARPKVSTFHNIHIQITFAPEFQLESYGSECRFRAYDQQLQLDNTGDEIVEKLDTGSSHIFARKIENLGSHPITIRLKLEFPSIIAANAAGNLSTPSASVTKSSEDIKGSSEAINSKGKKKKKKNEEDSNASSPVNAMSSPSPTPFGIESTLFSLVEGPDISIPGNGASSIQVKYTANDTSDDILREARIVIEFPGKVVDTWKEFARFSLFASTCRPRIEVSPMEIDFAHICLGASKSKTFTVENQGSGNVKYKVKPLKESQIFIIEPAEALSGEIPPKDVLQFQITFKPTDIGDFSFSIDVSTAFQTEIIEVFGKGAVLRLKKEQIPKELNFGEFLFGQDKELHFSVSNDCEIPLNVSCHLEGSDAIHVNPGITFEPSQTFTLPVILPAKDKKGRILKQQGPPPPNGGEQTISVHKVVPYPRFDETNAENHEEILNLVKLIGSICNSYLLRIIIEGGDQYSIPVFFSVKALSIQILPVDPSTGQVAENLVHENTMNGVEFLDFGQMNFFDTRSLSFAIRNPNNAPVKFQISKSHKQVSVDPLDCFVSANGTRMVTVTILAMSLDEVGIPRNEISDVLSITQNLLSDISFKIGVAAVQADLPINPEEILRPILFDEAYLLRKSVKSFNWINGTSLPKKYSATLVSDPANAFAFEPSAILAGEVPVKGNLEIPISFQPSKSLSYEAFLKLNIDTHEFAIQLTGIGLDYVVSLKPENLDLGTIDAERDNALEVTLSNENKIDLENIYIKTDPNLIVTPDTIASIPAQGKQILSCVIKGTGPGDTSLVGKEIVKRINSFMDVAGQTFRLSGVTIRAYGGHQSFILPGIDPEKGVHFSTPFSEGKTQKASFDIENTGDTKLLIEVLDENDDRLSSSKPFYGDDDLAVSFNPYEMSLLSAQKKSFTITVRGEKAGDFEKTYRLQSKGVIPPISVPIKVTGFIESNAALDGLRAFIKNDRSLDYILNVENAPENQYPSDDLLWKALKPIVRVSKARAMDNLYTVIPPIRPVVSEMDVSPFTVRPPAIPKDLGVGQTTRWFTNRNSLRFDRPKEDPVNNAMLDLAPPSIRKKLVATGERRSVAENFFREKEKSVPNVSAKSRNRQ